MLLNLVRKVVDHLDVFDKNEPRKVQKVAGLTNYDIMDLIFGALFQWLFGNCSNIKICEGQYIRFFEIAG